MDNRLQFRHHGSGSGFTAVDGVFETREDAIEYIYHEIKNSEEGLMNEDTSYAFSLYAEPTILRYKNEAKEDDPHVILAIGSYTNPTIRDSKNRFCIIDIDKTESEISELSEALEKAVKALSIIPIDSDTIDITAEKNEDGTYLSGDVRVAVSHYFENDRIYKDNKILKTSDGLFMFVGLEYDDCNDVLTFTVNDEEKTFKFANNYVVSGSYNTKNESLVLNMKHGEDVVISLENLIAEWVVEGEAADSPIVLKREEVGYGGSVHYHVEPWQDVLSADVRIANDRVNNILSKTSDNRYLYVDGVASNIVYYQNGVKTTVQDAIADLESLKPSSDDSNILMEKADGFFASTKLEYISSENTLVFTTSSNDPNERRKETRIKLNSFRLFENIYYDSSREALVITYLDGNGNVQIVSIPIGEMLQDWEWDVTNYGHSVFLQKERKVQGADQLSADVNIFRGNDNILEDVNHQLYVKGTADNIKYKNVSTVEEAITSLITSSHTISDKLETVSSKLNDTIEDLEFEVGRARAEEERIDAKLDQEISRSVGLDAALDNKINIETARATGVEETLSTRLDVEKDEREANDAKLQNEIDFLSGETSARLKSVVNNDHSIDVDNTDAVNPVIKVNLSEEIEDSKPNLIKLNNDGLYAGVDLEYTFNEDTGSSQLIFKTTNSTKIFDLRTNSVVDKIYYDAAQEAIIVEYTVNGHRMPDVVIPVGDLINEWRVWDGHEGAIQLEKIRVASGSTQQDILKAYAVISETHDDNILVNDNGALYVSGQQITDNKSDIDSLKESMTNAEESIETLEDNLSNEISRATNSEEEISNALDSEITRSTSIDEGLRQDLDNEISRSIEKDADIEGEIMNEINERQTADTAETVRAMSAETALSTALNVEKNERINADDTLRRDITDEVSRATNAENALATSITNEAARATAAEETNASAIASEISRSTAKDAELESSLADEISRATSSEASLNDRIDSLSDDTTYVVRSTNSITLTKAEESVGTSITADVNFSDEDGNIIKLETDGLYATADLTYDSLSNKLTFKTTNGEKEIALVSNSLVERVYYNASEEKIVIVYKVNGETMPDVEIPVRDLINEIDVASSSTVELTKTTHASSGPDIIEAQVKLNQVHDDNILIDDGGLYVSGAQIEANRLAIEELKNGSSSYSGRVEEVEAELSDEIARATEAEAALDSKITSEVSRSTAKDTELETNLTSEINRATAAESVLDTKIDSEITRSTNRDNELQSSLTDEINARETADTAETVRAMSAETALQTQVNALSSDVSSIETSLSTLNLRVSANTTSIASERSRAELAELGISNSVAAEEARATAAEAALDAKIDAKTFEVLSDDTTTIDMKVENGNKVSGNVLLANGDGNIIKASSDSALGTGLYASVDLTYDVATNKLKLITSALEKEISLSIGSILKSIEYDPIGKNLIIVYDTNSGGQIIEQSIFVPVEDLFNDWDVQSGQHLGAIILTKEEGVSGNPDILSAEIVISTLSDNMLVNDQGSLYVSRRPIDDVSGTVQNLLTEFEKSLVVEDTDTLHLERVTDRALRGNVKISSDSANLLRVENDGIMFDGDIDCGIY